MDTRANSEDSDDISSGSALFDKTKWISEKEISYVFQKL